MKAAFANCAWLASSMPAWLRFRRGLEQPEQTQRGIIQSLLARNAASAYGRKHGFDQIKSYEQFRERVPIVDYEAIEPWIARIVRGEQSVLTHEPATRLVPTSGSTGGRKLIPFTRGFQRELNAAIGPWIFELCRQHPGVALGPGYWSISPAIPDSAEGSAVPVGFDDDSAYLGKWRRRFVEASLAVPAALRLVKDVGTLRYITLLCLLRQRELRLVSVWHPSFFTLVLDALPAYWDELLRDLESGSCRRIDALSPELRQSIVSSPAPRRANELRQAGAADPHAIWPHLRVVSCWGDGQATLALSELRRRLPRAVIQPKGLLATEAFVSVPFRGHHPVAVTSHFFEFADTRGITRLPHELDMGERYEVIVTTGAGLWRYRLGDLVEVVNFVAATPSLRFLGRTGNVSDFCGEKLTEPFVTWAIETACTSVGIAPTFAMLAPEVVAGRWGYTLFAEGDLPIELPARLDQELRKNPHYALCRDLSQLGPLRCYPIASGGYETFSMIGVSEGQRIGAVKPRTLSLRTDWRRHFSSKPIGEALPNAATS